MTMQYFGKKADNGVKGGDSKIRLANSCKLLAKYWHKFYQDSLMSVCQLHRRYF